jgi:hypothetical protein
MKSVLLASWVILSLAGTGVSQEHETEYVGSKKCKMCHFKEYKSWNETKMAQALEVLKPGQAVEAKKTHGIDPDSDYTADAECLKCHTTGFGQPGGFVSVDETPEMAGVGCESCHGPGGDYLEEDLMSLKNKDHSLESVRQAGLVYPVTEETCKSQCHNENSPFFSKDAPFDFEKRKSQGVHESVPLRYKHE